MKLIDPEYAEKVYRELQEHPENFRTVNPPSRSRAPNVIRFPVAIVGVKTKAIYEGLRRRHMKVSFMAEQLGSSEAAVRAILHDLRYRRGVPIFSTRIKGVWHFRIVTGPRNFDKLPHRKRK